MLLNPIPVLLNFVLSLSSPLNYPAIVDVGQIYENERPFQCEIKLGNNGREMIEILSVETTCGCTVAEIEKKEIAPGEEIRLDVTIETLGKRGEMEKKITLKTREENYVIKVKGFVRKEVGAHSTGFLQKKIFNEPCASCHSNDEGKMSKELFAAVCSFCHGPNGSGGTAPSLNRLSFLSSVDDNVLYEVIANGREESGMPAFLDQYGGPLTREQVISLLPYLRRDEKLINRLKEEKKPSLNQQE